MWALLKLSKLFQSFKQFHGLLQLKRRRSFNVSSLLTGTKISSRPLSTLILSFVLHSYWLASLLWGAFNQVKITWHSFLSTDCLLLIGNYGRQWPLSWVMESISKQWVITKLQGCQIINGFFSQWWMYSNYSSTRELSCPLNTAHLKYALSQRKLGALDIISK